jgi:hypothetical protein
MIICFLLNGKSKDAWVEELYNYKNKRIYHYREGELSQLIKTITNLVEVLRKSGFRNLAKAGDKKIRELEKMQN